MSTPIKIEFITMPERVKAFRRRHEALLQDKTDEELTELLKGADDWINNRKWSASIVAYNYLVDGYYHP